MFNIFIRSQLNATPLVLEQSIKQTCQPLTCVGVTIGRKNGFAKSLFHIKIAAWTV